MMPGILRKVLPGTTTIPKSNDDDDEDDEYANKVEYSFAVEYSGPPLPYAIPRVVPVNVDEIPLASTLASASRLSVVPIIQPIVKSTLPKKRLPKELQEGESAGSRPEPFSTADNSNNLESENRSESSPVLLSGSSEIVEVPDDEDKDEPAGGLQDYAHPGGDGRSTKSHSFSCSVSSEIFSGNEDECADDETTPHHVRRPSAVTFRDPDSNDVVEDEDFDDASDAESSIPERPPAAVRPGKKGTCYRCMKGNRFTDKEVCIVCGAKFCSGCVLRAMGSMPEGRKCVTCIGQRIDEARRKKLGKSSRMLKQLLPRMEVKHIMTSERSCPVNQLPPELVHINGQYLSEEELVLLQTSAHPPRKLKPGYYWYDKVSGFWGKEGEKPCQIISDQLSIGGHMRRDASNGDTGILINNREITKPELLMLQLLGVKCDGTSSFWVSADGSYQEEGMKNVKGRIWDKPGSKVICTFLSLPTPPDSNGSVGKEPNGAAGLPKGLEKKLLQKLLLVGNRKSGTSTIFKQAKIIYHVPFSEDERESIKSIIQSNLYGYIGILLEGRERFEEECLAQIRKHSSGESSSSGGTDVKTMYSIGPRLKLFSDWLLKVMIAGNLEIIFPASTREYGPYVEELWKDAAVQATYNRRDELPSLPRNATYFLERAAEIAMVDYEPSDMDILYAEGITSSRGLSSMEFSFTQSPRDLCDHIGYQHDPSQRYQLIRAHPRALGGNCKWLQMFEDVDMVLFCVSLTDYDTFTEDSDGVLTNNMMATKQLFETMVTHPKFEDKKFLLVLNKFDLLEEKINRVPLNRCEWFKYWDPVIGHDPASSRSRVTNPSLAHRAFQYVAMEFKRFYSSLTDKKLYVSLITGLEADNVDEAFLYAREIMKWEEETFDLNNNNETSSTSMEASSSA